MKNRRQRKTVMVERPTELDEELEIMKERVNKLVEEKFPTTTATNLSNAKTPKGERRERKASSFVPPLEIDEALIEEHLSWRRSRRDKRDKTSVASSIDSVIPTNRLLEQLQESDKARQTEPKRWSRSDSVVSTSRIIERLEESGRPKRTKQKLLSRSSSR